MSKKKKVANNIKEKRRLYEAEKANMKSRFGVVFTSSATNPVHAETTKKDTAAIEKFSLPVMAIKHDMVKNGLYMVFVVIVLAVLKITGISF